MLISFRELNQNYDCNLILSLEGDNWIINDSRVGRDIFKCPFKHWKEFICKCKELNRDFVNAGFAFVGYKEVVILVSPRHGLLID